MTKCVGCGIKLQTSDPKKEGYIKSLEQSTCQRCFNITHYNKLEVSNIANKEFISIIKQVGATEDLVVLVIDPLDINKKVNEIISFLNNYIIVYTKKDLLPRYVKNHKILDYLETKCINKILVSAANNYNLDLLFSFINKYKTSNKVYFVGMTNSGKSTLINKLIYNYGVSNTKITTSIIPATTLSTIEIKLDNNLTLCDTPGLLDTNSILSKVDFKTLKRISIAKELKPTTLQITKPVTIQLDDLVLIDIKDPNSLTFYISNSITIKRSYKELETNLEKYELKVPANSDIVISGLGFIKVKKATNLIIYTLENTNIYVRKAMI